MMGKRLLAPIIFVAELTVMYYLIYGLVKGISLLPWFILYGLSDFFTFLAFNVIGYRKEVVFKNLLIAFPEKSVAERKRIAKESYRSFFDNFLEAFKLLSISDEELDRRFTGNYEAMELLRRRGGGSQIHLAHQFNFEWGNAHLSRHLPGIKFLAVYMPIKNESLDRIFRKFRARGGSILVPATNMREAMKHFKGDTYALALVADQNPGDPTRCFWLDYFNRPTPFVLGPEKGARRGNIPVFYACLRKVKRGYYHMDIILGEENPASLPEGEITRRYARFVEDMIRMDPTNYLWTHNRWKYEWNEEKHGALWVGNTVERK